jgi:hypothetical protein
MNGINTLINEGSENCWALPFLLQCEDTVLVPFSLPPLEDTVTRHYFGSRQQPPQTLSLLDLRIPTFQRCEEINFGSL